MTLHAGTGAAGSTFTLALVGIATRALAGFAKVMKNRLAVRELYQLDARALKDIGLVRSDVDAALDLPLHLDPSLHLVDISGGKRGRRSEKPATPVMPVRLDRVRRTDADLKPFAA
jgi:uncharacterized protein YjiS (DUF1127 family)